MDGFRSSLKSMFKREGEEVMDESRSSQKTHVQKRRRGDKWMDSERIGFRS
jgi:hypothetical protein